MANIKIMVCNKCKCRLFAVAVMDEKTRIICTNPACGNVQIDLTGGQEIFKRQFLEEIDAKQKSVIVTP